MKYEMKFEINRTSELKELIDKSYFDDNVGKLRGKKFHLKVENSDPIYTILKGLNNMTIRITNEELIDGCSRFVIDEHEDYINLEPCSIYCIIDNNKYCFY